MKNSECKVPSLFKNLKLEGSVLKADRPVTLSEREVAFCAKQAVLLPHSGDSILTMDRASSFSKTYTTSDAS